MSLNVLKDPDDPTNAEKGVPLLKRKPINYRQFSPNLDIGLGFRMVIFVPNENLGRNEQVDYYLVPRAKFLPPDEFSTGQLLQNDGTHIAFRYDENKAIPIYVSGESVKIRKNPEQSEKKWSVQDGVCYVYDPPVKKAPPVPGVAKPSNREGCQVQKFVGSLMSRIQEFCCDSKKLRKQGKIKRVKKALNDAAPISIGRRTIENLNSKDNPSIPLTVSEIKELIEKELIEVEIREKIEKL